MGNITLNDLANTPDTKKAVTINEMNLPKEEQAPVSTGNDYIAQQFGALDEMIDSAKQQREEMDAAASDEVINQNLENFDPTEDQGPIISDENNSSATTIASVDSKNTSAPVEEDTKSVNDVTEVKKDTTYQEEKTEKEFNSIFGDDTENSTDKELLDVLNDSTSAENESDSSDNQRREPTEEEKKMFERYRSELSSIITEHESVNTEGFSVSKKTISMSKLLDVKEPEKRIADWVQTTAKKPFSTIEYSGIELQKIHPDESSRNRINKIKERYRAIYNHLVGVPKDGFESWLRTTPFRDVPNFYFGAYKATFGDLNIVTYQCTNPSCNNIFIKELPFESMYEFDDEGAKEEFNRIFNGDTTLEVEFQEKIKPISSRFAVGLIEPSIYSVEIEPLLITDDMRVKYSKIINFLQFIKRLYYIDLEKKAYIPIDESAVPQDIAKTTKHKLAIYYKILDSLTNDQIAVLQVEASKYLEHSDHLSFHIPECTCPECGKVIPKNELTPQELLFIRAQSPLAVNSSEK